MFSAAGAPLDESKVRVLNMRAATAEQIVAALDGAELATPDAEPAAAGAGRHAPRAEPTAEPVR